MYINPFWLGFIVGIIATIIVLVVLIMWICF